MNNCGNEDRIISTCTGATNDEDLARIIAQLCSRRQYKAAIEVLRSEFGYDYGKFFTVSFDMSVDTGNEELLKLLCQELVITANEFIHLQTCGNSDWLIKCFNSVYSHRYKWSQSCIVVVAQCLEQLWAFGIDGVKILIVKFYGCLDFGPSSEFTEVRLAQKLAYVYIIDQYNAHKIDQQLKEVRRHIKRAGYKHLKGLFHYYRALSLRFDVSSNIMATECFFTDLEKSIKADCELAEIYIHHHRISLRYFDEL